ncbi:hypothetical protein LLH03_17545 [bacterium]|nr:hypothetical protein [bacterium]
MQTSNRREHVAGIAAVAALLLMLAGVQSSLAAAEQSDVNLLVDKPLLHVATFSQAPKLDGLLDDLCWSTAQQSGPFWHFQTGEASRNDTWAKMGIDRDYLYVAFRCAEAEMAKLKADKLPPDSMSLFANDHIEFFLMPDALGAIYYHFSVDVAGNRHDELGNGGDWTCDWQAAVNLAGDSWTVEMRLPRKAIGLTDPQMSLANFCRTRRLEPAETSAWSTTFGAFHNPSRFGRLVYGPTSGIDFAALTLRQPKVGVNHLHVTLTGADQPAEVVVEGYRRDREATSLFGVRKVRLFEGRSASLSWPLRVDHDTRAGLLVAVRRAGHVLTFCDAAEVALSGAKAKPIPQLLSTETAPSLRWIDQQRLRGISYGVGFSAPMPEDGLVKAAAATASGSGDTLRLRGEYHFRLLLEHQEELRFELAATAGDSPFTSSIYAVFDPQGKVLSTGIVEAGKTAQVSLRTTTEGHYTLLVNSGPACWNPFAITFHNPYWALDARGKSTYLSTPLALHSFRDCTLAGMNLALMATWSWGIPFKDETGLANWSAAVEKLCQASQDAGIKLIPYLGWGCAQADCDAAGDYTRALTRLSVRGPQPCPISREYWERSFLRRALEVAKLSKKYPAVIGVGLDPESYYFGGWYATNLKSPEEQRRAGSIYMPYGPSREKCVCNRCFEGYLESRGLRSPSLPEDGNARFDWIEKQNLLDDYCAYQQAELERLLGEIRERVQKVNPDLCFAVMLLSIDDNWFCRGMARGLGTPRTPALDFDEGTYTPGYSAAAVDRKRDLYAKWGAHVLHGGTLWTLKHPPANPHFLSSQMFNFALYGDGYWVWPGAMSLWRSANEVAGYYSLSGYPEDYWKAIVTANQEVDKRLAAPDTYRSPLEQLQQRPTIPVEPATGKKNEWAQKPCYPVHVYAGTRLSFVVPSGRKQLQVHWGYRETLGQQTLVVSLAGQERRLTASVEAEKDNVADFEVPAGGCTGWIELQAPAGTDATCIGVNLVGAKPFFGAADGMRLQ